MATKTMRAGIATASGIALHEMPRPTPGDDQILVKVQAAGINRADLSSSKTQPGAPLTVVGREWAGEVVEVGKNVTTIRVGQMVACAGFGGYAEYAVTDAGLALPFNPKDISVQKAAVMPLVLMTTHDAMITHGQLKPGQSVLVNGASSAVGILALQIARLKGATVIAGTSRNPSHRARLAEFGATVALDSTKPDWADQLLQATNSQGVDLCVDMVAGPTVNGIMKSTKILGRIVNIGRLGGNHGEMDFDLHALRRLTYVGVTFRTRNMNEQRVIAANVRDELWADTVAGRLALPIDEAFALKDVAAAHAKMNANAMFGKLVLTV